MKNIKRPKHKDRIVKSLDFQSNAVSTFDCQRDADTRDQRWKVQSILLFLRSMIFFFHILDHFNSVHYFFECLLYEIKKNK